MELDEEGARKEEMDDALELVDVLTVPPVFFACGGRLQLEKRAVAKNGALCGVTSIRRMK